MNPAAKLQIDGGTEDILRARINGSTKLLLASNGGLSIGTYKTDPPANGLWVYGQVYANNGVLIGSDISLKKDILSLNNSLNKVLKLNGVSYLRKYDEFENLCDSIIENDPIKYEHKTGISKANSSKREIGLIAQEVEEVVPEVVTTMGDGTKAIAYTELIALLVEAIKDLDNKVNTKDILIADLEKRISEQEKNSIKQQNNNGVKSANNMQNIDINAELIQNNPNPFSEKTMISYYLSNNVINASMYIYDMQGNQIKNFHLENRGESSLTINGSELSASMYMYTLIADNEIIDTKRMILTK